MLPTERIAPGINPAHADPADMSVDVMTPSGATLAVDPELMSMLNEGVSVDHTLTLVRSEGAMTDCRPVSLISLQPVERIGEVLGTGLIGRFRANNYMDFESAGGYGEDGFVGRSLRIGPKAVVAILERDLRC